MAASQVKEAVVAVRFVLGERGPERTGVCLAARPHPRRIDCGARRGLRIVLSLQKDYRSDSVSFLNTLGCGPILLKIPMAQSGMGCLLLEGRPVGLLGPFARCCRQGPTEALRACARGFMLKSTQCRTRDIRTVAMPTSTDEAGRT